MVEFTVLEFLQGEGAEYFNYFFTLVMACGWIAFGFAILVKMISRA